MPSTLRRVLRSWAITLALPGLAIGLAGCTTGEGRTALAIERTSRVDHDTVAVYTECADIHEVTITPDHGGSTLPEVTVWGRPKVGSCESRAEVAIDSSEDRIVDGTTSMVVHLTDVSTP